MAQAKRVPDKTIAQEMSERKMLKPSDIEWKNAPPIFPAGAKQAVLEGDPSKPGYFTTRMRLPDGYKIMPHSHPNAERLTVISGSFSMGLGDKFDDSKGDAMPAGSYASMPPNVHHYAWTKGETEIQLSTIGPWKLLYVNPADDPSKKK